MRRCPKLLAALLIALPASGCGEPDNAPTPELERTGRTIVLVTLDTTRADRLGAYGHTEARTPVLDTLARTGVLFTRAWTLAPITLPSHTTILTGVPPALHGLRDNGLYHAEAEARLVSEVLAEEGWRTGAFVGAWVLDRSFGLAQGFERYDGPAADPFGGQPLYAERPFNAVVDAARQWLAAIPPDEDAFLWVHAFDPHAPYSPPPGPGAALADPYDGEIAHVDAQLGRLLSSLRATRAPEQLWVLAAADHGESLGEHGERTHGVFLYDATMRIPMILHGPDGALPAGSRSDTVVSLQDVAPTLLDIASLDSSRLPAATGVSLLTQLGEDASNRPVPLESLLPYHAYRWRALRGLVADGLKLIDDGTPELYDLAADPLELVDLTATDPARAEPLAQRLETLLATQTPLGWASSKNADATDRARLIALGYAPGTAGEAPFDPALPAASERHADLALRDRALSLLTHARRTLGLDPPWHETFAALPPEQQAAARLRGHELLEEARAVLELLRSHHAVDPFAITHLGMVEMSTGNWDAAAVLFEQHALAEPGSANTRVNLAECYRNLEHGSWAVAEAHKAVRLEPASPRAYEWLLAWHTLHEEWGRALGWMDAYRSALSPGAAARLAPRAGALETRRRASRLPVIPATPADAGPLRGAELLPERLRPH